MEDTTIKNLIASWQDVNQQTSPSSLLFKSNIDIPESLNDLSFVSSRKEFWESSVCLLSFTETRRRAPEIIITEVATNMGSPVAISLTDDFFNHSQKYTDLSKNLIETSVGIVINVSSPQKLAQLIPRMTQFELCRRLYPTNPDKFKECLLKI